MTRRLGILLIALVVAYSPVWAATPAIKEFIDGKRTKFSTQGHAKAKGLEMTVAYPKSWAAKEGERPNIVQKFVSDGGRGLEMVMIITKTLPLPAGTKISEAELKEFFTPAEMKEMLPEGAKFIDAKATKIEGLPAGILEYSMRRERAGMTLDMQVIAYIFIHGTTMVQLHCQVGGPPTNGAPLNQHIGEFLALFVLMANSIVLQDNWK